MLRKQFFHILHVLWTLYLLSNVDTFFDNHLTGNKAINYEALLEKVGVVKKVETVQSYKIVYDEYMN